MECLVVWLNDVTKSNSNGSPDEVNRFELFKTDTNHTHLTFKFQNKPNQGFFIGLLLT